MASPDTKRDPGDRRTDERPLVAVVDDDASVRQSTCRLIRSFGHRAEAFGSGDEFLSSGVPAQTACLVLDVRMPGMDGLEVQRRLAESGPRVPIVFITGRASELEEQRARAAGAIAFLRKPVARANLQQAIENALRASARIPGDRDGE
jgi:FixJ family two-component response regulator